ncbi:hypothetical protein CO251_07575 [Sulfobacillus sp. hq2]|nr:hypothetical protein CO251_07575 [Sulfobacillus sp. hq2]
MITIIQSLTGGIAAYGGILIGIIAIVTLTQIHKQVDARFDQKYHEHETKLNEQSAQWATGIRYWTQSVMTPDLSEATDLMEQALSAWPSAPGARTEMLRRLFNETRRAYLIDLVPGQRQWKKSANVGTVAGITSFDPPQELPVAHRKECLVWLTKALDHEADVDRAGLLLTAAQIYAMEQDFDMMLSYFEQWNTTGAPLASDDIAIPILLSSIHTLGQYSQFEQLWNQRFSAYSLNVAPQDVVLNLKQQNSPYGQKWLVVPKHPTSTTRLVWISTAPQGWDVNIFYEGGREEVKNYNSDEDLIAVIIHQWILLRSIPDFIGWS